VGAKQLEDGVIGTFVQLPCFRASGVMSPDAIGTYRAKNKAERDEDIDGSNFS
jgi:hypothetical protein